MYLVKEQGEAAISDKKAAPAKKGCFQGNKKDLGSDLHGLFPAGKSAVRAGQPHRNF